MKQSQEQKTFYRYRAFSIATLDMLCHDALYFANPSTFNDPLDCNPSLECDSDPGQLRTLLATLVQRRVSAEVLESLRRARVLGERATLHANRRAQTEAANELANIAYHATNPDYKVSVEEAEAWLLTEEVERELNRHYERGVCCFSTTYSSPLLWSHYGDQHQGLCIGYGTDRLPKPKLQKVIYGGSRALKTSTLVDAFVHKDQGAQEELDRSVLLRKAKGWSYEREWRLVGDQGLQSSPVLLKEVVFGLRCPQSVIHAVVRALDGREKAVRFYGMREVPSQYLLRRRVLEIDELEASLPNTASSGEEMFGPSIDTNSNEAATSQAE